jgi:hypothetical protein
MIALRLACFATLGALAMMAWGILQPKPLAVIAAMSVGQGLGTLGALLFGLVVLPDIKPLFRKRASAPPPPPESSPDAEVGSKSERKAKPGPDSKPEP